MIDLDLSELDEMVSALESQILDSVDNMEDEVNGELIDLAHEITQQLRAGSFNNQSGNLRTSMLAAVVNDNTLAISMLYYGYFLSFGVAPSNRTFGLTPEVASEFRGKATNNIFQRKQGAGISAFDFYPRNVITSVNTILQNAVQGLNNR